MEKLLIGFVLFLSCNIALHNRVDGTECFICHSREQPDCGALFMLETSRTNAAPCSTSCYKFVAERGDVQAVSRGCLPEVQTPVRCQSHMDHGLRGVMCTCNTDYCNDTSGLKANVVLSVFMVFLSIKRIL